MHRQPDRPRARRFRQRPLDRDGHATGHGLDVNIASPLPGFCFAHASTSERFATVASTMPAVTANSPAPAVLRYMTSWNTLSDCPDSLSMPRAMYVATESCCVR